MSGPELMREMRIQFPNLSIEELLDKVRSTMIDRHLIRLRAVRTNDVLDLLVEMRKWDPAEEDVLAIMDQIAKTFPEPVATDAAILLESHSVWHLYKFLCKIKKDPEPSGWCCCPIGRY